MLLKKYNLLILSALCVVLLNVSCSEGKKVAVKKEVPFVWEAANVYFLLTDRFKNGTVLNDINYGRSQQTSLLRGFEGGDIQGITNKINEGYFNKLGINAIWMTPVMEQIHGMVDEGSGQTYGFHGYWIKDWTALDLNFGTRNDLQELVETAHAHGIRILLDAVINHRGPVTSKDEPWDENWVRTGPTCTYKDYESTVSCNLVENLPDIKTESDTSVGLPIELVEKWKLEGRYDQELRELDSFFERTGYPKAPRYYIMKWLSDYITEFGIDGYRVDTVKHTEESVWKEFKDVCEYSFQEWKKMNPTKVLDQNSFFTVAEVYNFNISSALAYDFGDKKVNYFENGFNSIINFEFKYNASAGYEALFSSYSRMLNEELEGFSVMNYFSSHDDGTPFDVNRVKNKESAIKLLLSPGISQVYYGDESDRVLNVENAVGDAKLRSYMNWTEIENDIDTKEKLKHWQKLGRFRRDHPSVGAGEHRMISETPYCFSRVFRKGDFEDRVLVGLDLSEGSKVIPVRDVFRNGEIVIDAYSNKEIKVVNGLVEVNTPYDIVLLSLK